MKYALLTCEVPAILEDDQTSSSSDEEEEEEDGEDEDPEEREDQTQEGEETPVDRKVTKSLLAIQLRLGDKSVATVNCVTFFCWFKMYVVPGTAFCLIWVWHAHTF